jgi:hypothetical protein
MTIEAKSAAAVAAGSGAATVLSMVGEVALQILGVPLPVVLAAGTGAWIARSYTPAANLLTALVGTAGWTLAGCFTAPFAQWIVKSFSGSEMPTNALAGIALCVSLVLPMVVPIVRQKLPEVIGARLDRWKGRPDRDGGAS